MNMYNFLVLFRLDLEIEIQRYIDIYVDFRARLSLCVYRTHVFHCIYVAPARDLSLILCIVII